MDNIGQFVTYYEIPDDSSIIWRYLDLAKYVSLLKDKSLFMTRADKFKDVFEGAVALLSDKEEYDKALKKYFDDVSEGTATTDILVEQSHKAGELLRSNSFVNCWCESDHESMAMWRLYAAFNEPKGVAIRSTVGRLRQAIGQAVEIGRIGYIDYSKTWLNPNEALWRKRRSFEYEHEVRIRIIPKEGLSDNPPKFMTLAVNLDQLIDSVYVSPMSEPWFKDVVEDVMNKYNVNKAVLQSGLDSEALY